MINFLSNLLTALGGLGIAAFWIFIIGMLMGYFINIYHFVIALLHPTTVVWYEWLLMIVGFFHLFIGGIVGWVM